MGSFPRRGAGLVFLICGPALAQQQVLTFHSDVDSSDQPYAIYVPANLDRARSYPLVISLHMEEASHVLNLRQLLGRSPNLDFIVASPLARGSMGYRGVAEKDVYDVLADVKRRYPVDDDRVYLTGASMGGGGTLWLGLTRPDVWAAMAPVCADPPAGIEDLAGNALHLPVLLFQGEEDPIVPARSSRQWQKRFLEQGAPAEYIEYPGLRHNAWDLAYRGGAVFDWFGKLVRNRYPERVRLVARAYRDASAYWLRRTAIRSAIRRPSGT